MFETRPMCIQDVPACVEIVNHIIALGGTTAYEKPFTDATFAADYLEKAPVSVVAISGERVVGFQGAFDVGNGMYSIGSFTDQRDPVRGAGRALFAQTLAGCRAHGGHTILARITSDNLGGLAYYSALGFEDWKVVPDDHTRSDGTTVDRIVKRYEL